MIQPDEAAVRGFAYITQTMPAVKEFVDEWRTVELERLPQATTSPAVAQGRCQVLQELAKLLNDAPTLAAPPRG